MYLRIWKTRPGQQAAWAGRQSLHMPAPCACVQPRQYWLFSLRFMVPLRTTPGWQRQPAASKSEELNRPMSQGAGLLAPLPGAGAAVPARKGSGMAAAAAAAGKPQKAAGGGWSTTPGAPHAAGRLSTPADTSLSLGLGLAAEIWSFLALQGPGERRGEGGAPGQ